MSNSIDEWTDPAGMWTAVAGECIQTMSQERASSAAPAPGILQLLRDAITQLESRLTLYPASPAIREIRPSDFRLFMVIPHHPVTISQMARKLGVSRQAVHASINRLARFKIVRLAPAPGSRRDKIMILTDEGNETRESSAKRIAMMETSIDARLGNERAAALRDILEDLAFGDWAQTEIAGQTQF